MTNEIKELIATEVNLPTPPTIAVQILNTLQKEESALQDLTKIITADPSLTGKMLQFANSGFYSISTTVTSIERALSVLGTNVIKNIALSFVFATDLRHPGEGNNFDLDRYWRHSVTSAVAAELLSQKIGQNHEDIFVTALLHNIGMLVLTLQKKDNYLQILKSAELDHGDQVTLEKNALGYDHQQVGQAVIESWKLPASIYGPIRYHHQLESAPSEYREAAAAISFADRLASICIDKECAEKVRLLQSELRNSYSLNDEDIRSLIDQVAEKSVETLTTFEIDPGDIRPYSQLLQEANEELGRLNLSYEQLVIELKEAKEKSERLAHELSEANKRLNDLAYTDSLTGLYNHRFFQQSLDTELSRAQRYSFSFSLILFDIDHFKKVNDTYGHPAGDQVLITLAKAVKSRIRPSDILARYGGEEFAVILPQTDLAGLKVFAARIRRSVEGVITSYEDKQIMVTTSLGGTTFNPKQVGTTRDQLFETADRALYISKNNGRNQETILAMETAPSYS